MMRFTFLVTGLGLVGSLGCGDSSVGGDLFASSGAGGFLSTSGSGTAGSVGTGNGGTGGSTNVSSGASGSAVGTGGSAAGTGNATAGAGGSAGGSAGSAGMTGSAGAAGSTAGSGGAAGAGTSDGGAGASGRGGSAGGSAGARPDGGIGGGGGNPVEAGPPDAGTEGSIRCGNTTCEVATQFCCIPATNNLPRCVANSTPNLCAANADTVRCDDRTDCPNANQVCCAQVQIGVGGALSMCRTLAGCNGQGQTEELCEPSDPAVCLGGGTNSCRADNQSIIIGYAYCH